MQITKEQKGEIFKKFGQSETDAGSTEAQIALFTERINHLTAHLKEHPKDHNTRRSLLKTVGKRKKLLTYLREKDIEEYRSLIKQLGIRK